jgi:RNA methyltransferase, TrmH family
VEDTSVLHSPRNPRVVAAAALHDARARRREGLHLAEGARVCREALAVADVVELFHTGGHEDVVRTAGASVRVTRVDERVMARISDAATPPGIAAVVRTPSMAPAVGPTGSLLVLDHVADPGNVGTLLRTAAALGVAVLSVAGADPFGPKAVRASAGTCYRARIARVEDEGLDVGQLRGDGRPILGLAADGPRRLDEAAREVTSAGFVLVVGSEPHGLGRGVRDAVDVLVRIPMQPGIESMNVAAAGAIAMHALTGP